ncbi:hypothetical protein BDF14DRAFT_1745235 [Spinellus fusiger]|nr:hypothetical protein BDF14DRAFT_1745235 [Spinellus fusiger]
MIDVPRVVHRIYVRSLYRTIIREGTRFFDDRARTYIVTRAKKIFREYVSCTDYARVQNKLAEGRKRANEGHSKSALKVLEEAYGRKGKNRHRLMHPYVYENFPSDAIFPSPLVAHIPHTAPPPPLCNVMCALVESMGKEIEPVLPVPLYKPLHRGRHANLLWKWRSNLLERVQLPLPFEIVCELEKKAGIDPKDPRGASVLNVGGPRWRDMYRDYSQDEGIGHLCPTTPLVRRSSLPGRCELMSPYIDGGSSFAPMTLIQCVDPGAVVPVDTSATISSQETLDNVRSYRRLYRQLLATVPYVSPLPKAAALWQDICYTVSHSSMVPNTVLTLLKDEQISEEEAMRPKGKKRKERK